MSGNPHCDYVQSCLYINPEVQNASDLNRIDKEELKL